MIRAKVGEATTRRRERNGEIFLWVDSRGDLMNLIQEEGEIPTLKCFSMRYCTDCQPA